MANRTRVYGLLGLVGVSVLVTSPTAWAADPPPEEAEAWASKIPIDVCIMSPAANTYVPINHTQALTALAFDLDCYKVNDVWYDYYDDVTSGTTETDHHMWWTASKGTFKEMYGPSAKYVAPDYEECPNDVRDVTVTAHAVDFNLGKKTQNTHGYHAYTEQEEIGQASITLKIWQITVEYTQSGNASDAYGGVALPAEFGGGKLGWIAPGDPAGAAIYGGGTKVTGIIPDEPGVVDGFHWYQRTHGVEKYRTKNDNLEHHALTMKKFVEPGPDDWEEGDIDTYGDPEDDYPYMNESPYNSQWNYVGQIVLLDTPGFEAGAGNNERIAAPDNWTDYVHAMTYQTWVIYKTGERISNQCSWTVQFTLEADGQTGTWQLVGGHHPN